MTTQRNNLEIYDEVAAVTGIDPAMFIRPDELRSRLADAGLEAGRLTGLAPRGLNRRGDPTFGPLPFTGIIYMGIARKPG